MTRQTIGAGIVNWESIWEHVLSAVFTCLALTVTGGIIAWLHATYRKWNSIDKTLKGVRDDLKVMRAEFQGEIRVVRSDVDALADRVKTLEDHDA